MGYFLELSKLECLTRKSKGAERLGRCERTADGVWTGISMAVVAGKRHRERSVWLLAFPTLVSKIPLHPCAWTYHHEELTSGVSQVKSRGSQGQIPPRGAFILTPLRLHQVRLRVRAPCVPRAEALSAGSASSRQQAPRRAPAPRASAASGETR